MFSNKNCFVDELTYRENLKDFLLLQQRTESCRVVTMRGRIHTNVYFKYTVLKINSVYIVFNISHAIDIKF